MTERRDKFVETEPDEFITVEPPEDEPAPTAEPPSPPVEEDE